VEPVGNQAAGRGWLLRAAGNRVRSICARTMSPYEAGTPGSHLVELEQLTEPWALPKPLSSHHKKESTMSDSTVYLGLDLAKDTLDLFAQGQASPGRPSHGAPHRPGPMGMEAFCPQRKPQRGGSRRRPKTAGPSLASAPRLPSQRIGNRPTTPGRLRGFDGGNFKCLPVTGEKNNAAHLFPLHDYMPVIRGGFLFILLIIPFHWEPDFFAIFTPLCVLGILCVRDCLFITPCAIRSSGTAAQKSTHKATHVCSVLPIPPFHSFSPQHGASIAQLRPATAHA
jgi:hypothetical protein